MIWSQTKERLTLYLNSTPPHLMTSSVLHILFYPLCLPPLMSPFVIMMLVILTLVLLPLPQLQQALMPLLCLPTPLPPLAIYPSTPLQPPRKSISLLH